ncbi:MAG: ABC transporter permease subunit [Pseudomonadota bacterium]
MAQKINLVVHRDPRIRAIFFQITIPILVVYGLYLLLQNAFNNLEERGIRTSFDFLDTIAPFAVGFSPFLEFKLGESTYWQVFFIGIQNTILVAILGIIAATLLGFIIGVMRLSPNLLISRFATVYIEILRNIPLLLQIFFWNFAVFLVILPPVRESYSLFETVFLNQRGLYLPKATINNETGFLILCAIVIAGIVGAIFLRRWAYKRHDETGQLFPARLVGVLGVFVLAILGFFALGGPITFELPQLGRFNFSGGFELPLPMFSLWFALTTYTSAFIAENVRAGIQSVPKGQTEAAQAVGLSRAKMLQKVIIPQAMRVIIPPTISQYLNLTKNSSLAVAVAYEEIVAIFMGIALNQTGQAVTIIIMTMAVYITLSLLTSLILNLYNNSVQLVER